LAKRPRNRAHRAGGGDPTLTTLSPKLILSAAGIIVLFIMVSLAQEMNRRLSVQREVAQLETEVRALEKSVIEMENLNNYFRTDAFRERMAREKLNYRAPGEEVVLLPAENIAREVPEAGNAEPAEVSIPRRWWNVFFTPRTGEV
jgi:cell division protein FtsB